MHDHPLESHRKSTGFTHPGLQCSPRCPRRCPDKAPDRVSSKLLDRVIKDARDGWSKQTSKSVDWVGEESDQTTRYESADQEESSDRLNVKSKKKLSN